MQSTAPLFLLALSVAIGVSDPPQEPVTAQEVGAAHQKEEALKSEDEALEAFRAFWSLENGRKRSELGRAWIARAKVSELGPDAFLLPLARYVFEDYRERPARSREIYEALAKLERAPLSLDVTGGFAARFVLGPLLGEIDQGNFQNVESIVRVIVEAEDDPCPSLLAVARQIRTRSDAGSAEALAAVVREAAAASHIEDQRLVQWMEELFGRAPEEDAPRAPAGRRGQGRRR